MTGRRVLSRCRAALRRRSPAAAAPPLTPACKPLCRHTAALVSRRWHAAVHSPRLLAMVRCAFNDAQQMDSLATWLQRHGQHVRDFGLVCTLSAGNAVPCTWQLAGCLTALAVTARPLQNMRVAVYGTADLCVASWGAAMQQLKLLHLECPGSTLHISSSLAGLTALSSLRLWGYHVTMDAAAQLPPNVERMSFSDMLREALPQQVSQYTLSREACLSKPCQCSAQYHVQTCSSQSTVSLLIPPTSLQLSRMTRLRPLAWPAKRILAWPAKRMSGICSSGRAPTPRCSM